MAHVWTRPRLAPGQIGTDRLPMFAGIERAEQAVRAAVEGPGRVPREKQRCTPVKPVSRHAFRRTGPDQQIGSGSQIDAVEQAVLGFEVSEVRMAGIDLALEPIHTEQPGPIAAGDAIAPVGGAGTDPATVVLEPAVNSIGP